ncbi:hypothetical protein ACHAQA_009195 [Verticillium albo-atrum]
MSQLQYFSYEGFGTRSRRETHYSQAVRVGNTIKCSGQGGWDDEGTLDVNDTAGQIQRAFANVEKNLRDAGARGWEDVYLVRSYHTSMVDQFPLTVEALRKWTPNHQPTWTCLGVATLAVPAMVVEIEVEAIIS